HLVNQYYFKRRSDAIEPAVGDHVIDAGSCFGDTALRFGASVGPRGHVYSIEVLSNHIDIARFNLAQNPEISNITLLPFALAHRNQDGPNPVGAVDPGFSLASHPDAPTRRLDDLVNEQSIRKVDFIK